MSPKFKTDTCRFAQLVTNSLVRNVANHEKLVETHRDYLSSRFLHFPISLFMVIFTKFEKN